MSKYEIIYADPPWTYRDKGCAGKRGVQFKYPTMSIYDIKALPVNNISANDSVLFLRNKIVELMGDIPRIELFAREKTTGWSAWGNEIVNDIELVLQKV